MLMIMIYIGLRFDYKYAPGAIIALIHDVIIVIGFFIILYAFIYLFSRMFEK